MGFCIKLHEIYFFPPSGSTPWTSTSRSSSTSASSTTSGRRIRISWRSSRWAELAFRKFWDFFWKTWKHLQKLTFQVYPNLSLLDKSLNTCRFRRIFPSLFEKEVNAVDQVQMKVVQDCLKPGGGLNGNIVAY